VTAWEAFHVPCPPGAGRVAVLGALARAVGGPWTFVDAGDLLEVAVPPHAGASAAHAVRAELGAGGTVGEVHPVCAFLPEVFPGGVLPDVLLAAFAAAVPRTVAAIAAAGGRGRVADDVVAEHLLAEYHSFLDGDREVAGALRWHAAWLTRVAARATAPGAAPPAVALAADDVVRRAAAWPELVALRPALEAHVAAVTGAGATDRAADLDGATARQMVLARLVHGEAVRAWGPDEPDQLRREAAVLRALLPVITSST
jgi:hypothetical protein